MSKRCQFWKDYDSVSGGISYCELAAFNQPVNPEFLIKIGCTEQKRTECLGTMQLNIGGAAVPVVQPTACNAPGEIAKTCVGAAEKKAAIAPRPLSVLAFLAGAYIAMAGILNTVITNDLANYFGDGLTRLIGGAVFSLGLILVILAGAELFTGNNLVMTAGLLDRKITFDQVLRNWGTVYFFNFIGSVTVAVLIYFSGIWKFNGTAVGIKAVNVALGKVSLPFSEALVRGILCNWLVCLAVWLSMSAKDAVGKLISCALPVIAFVAMGFEHSIANMYFIPMGIFLSGQEAIVAAIGTEALQGLTWSAFFIKNLLPVTIGNMIGGRVCVAATYYNAYLRPSPAKEEPAGKVKPTPVHHQHS